MADQAMGGEWSGTEDATGDTQKICDAVKDQVEKETGKKYALYKAVQFWVQVGKVFNFTIKVFAGEEDYIHLDVVQHLPCYGGKVELHRVEEGKTKNDPLGTFP